MQDFRADFQKSSRRNRDLWPQRYPKHFYYLVPESLAVDVLPKLPEWAGLLALRDCWVEVAKPAPANPLTERYTLKECVRLAHMREQRDFGG